MKERKRTDKPFSRALRELMDERGIGYPVLERLTGERAYRSLSRTMLNNLVLGRNPVNKDQIEIISAALKIDPMYFAEYRKFVAGEALEDPELVDALLELAEKKEKEKKKSQAKTS